MKQDRNLNTIYATTTYHTRGRHLVRAGLGFQSLNTRITQQLKISCRPSFPVRPRGLITVAQDSIIDDHIFQLWDSIYLIACYSTMLAIVTVLFKYVSNPKHFAVLGSLFLLAELAINYLIINFVKCKLVERVLCCLSYILYCRY